MRWRRPLIRGPAWGEKFDIHCVVVVVVSRRGEGVSWGTLSRVRAGNRSGHLNQLLPRDNLEPPSPGELVRTAGCYQKVQLAQAPLIDVNRPSLLTAFMHSSQGGSSSVDQEKLRTCCSCVDR